MDMNREITQIWLLNVEAEDGQRTTQAYLNRHHAEMKAKDCAFGTATISCSPLVTAAPQVLRVRDVVPDEKAESRKHTQQVATPSSDDDNDILELGTDAPQKTPKSPKTSKPKKELTQKQQEAKDARQKAPTCEPDALLGVKVMFAGTFKLEHGTLKSAMIGCGGEPAKKAEDAHYIVVGERPSEKQVEAMAACSVEQITEDAFLGMLKGDASERQLKRVADKNAGSEVAAKKQKK